MDFDFVICPVVLRPESQVKRIFQVFEGIFHPGLTPVCYDRPYNLPVIYLTQLIGLTLGMGIKDLGLDKLVKDPAPLLQEKGLL